jgi:hypothetical protein
LFRAVREGKLLNCSDIYHQQQNDLVRITSSGFPFSRRT